MATTQPDLPPGFRLLCRFLASDQPAQAAGIARDAAGVADWDQVVAAAIKHRVTALLPPAFDALLPERPRRRLEAARRRAVLRGLARIAAIRSVSDCLSEHGIRFLLLKGLVLSQLRHGDAFMRGGGDIDILVDPARLWDAHDALVAIGFQLDADQAYFSEIREAAAVRIRDLTLHHPAHGAVDLHQRLAEDPAFLDLDFEDVWAVRRGVTLPGKLHVATLSDDHLALHLLLHGASHGWALLFWLVDVRYMLDPASMGGSARALIAAQGLDRAAAELHEISAFLFAAAPAPATSRVRRYIKHFVAGDAWWREPTARSARWYRRELSIRFHFYAIKGTASSFISQIWWFIAYPADWGLWRLPKRAQFLYPLLRPAGWIWRRIRAAQRRMRR